MFCQFLRIRPVFSLVRPVHRAARESFSTRIEKLMRWQYEYLALALVPSMNGPKERPSTPGVPDEEPPAPEPLKPPAPPPEEAPEPIKEPPGPAPAPQREPPDEQPAPVRDPPYPSPDPQEIPPGPASLACMPSARGACR